MGHNIQTLLERVFLTSRKHKPVLTPFINLGFLFHQSWFLRHFYLPPLVLDLVLVLEEQYY